MTPDSPPTAYRRDTTTAHHHTTQQNQFLYWDEVAQTFRDGHSILVYQHFPRIERTAFLNAINIAVSTKLGASELLVFRTANVAFILIPQQRHLDHFHRRAAEVRRVWSGHIGVLHSLLTNPVV